MNNQTKWLATRFGTASRRRTEGGLVGTSSAAEGGSTLAAELESGRVHPGQVVELLALAQEFGIRIRLDYADEDRTRGKEGRRCR